MTIQELKNLKVGDVVKHTKISDPLDIMYWELVFINEDGLQLKHCKGLYVSSILWFNDPDLEYFASMLSIDQMLKDNALDANIAPDTDRQLRLIEAKIKDAEFDVKMWHDLLCALSVTDDLDSLELTKDKENVVMGKLIALREQRYKLIEQI
jgi:hypothetical protein